MGVLLAAKYKISTNWTLWIADNILANYSVWYLELSLYIVIRYTYKHVCVCYLRIYKYIFNYVQIIMSLQRDFNGYIHKK